MRPKAIESANQLEMLSLVAKPFARYVDTVVNSDRIQWRHFMCICTSGMEQAPLAQAEDAEGKWDYGSLYGDEKDVAVFLTFLASQEP